MDRRGIELVQEEELVKEGKEERVGAVGRWQRSDEMRRRKVVPTRERVTWL
jgi:hypothetical protein